MHDSQPGHVYDFDHEHKLSELDRLRLYPPDWLRGLIGGKGAYLARMRSLGIRVPPGFTISTTAYREWRRSGAGDLPVNLKEEIELHYRLLTEKVERDLTPGRDPAILALPLLVSVRSGAPQSMPGMLETVLNVGVRQLSIEDVRQLPVFELDCYRRFLSSYGRTVMGVDTGAVEASVIDAAASTAGLTRGQLIGLVGKHQTLLAKTGGVPADALDQVYAAVAAVFRSYEGHRAESYRRFEHLRHDDAGTAVSVQAMVFGNLNERSGSGVAYSRDPSTGAKGMTGDYRGFSQGPDVVGGAEGAEPLEQLKERARDLYATLDTTVQELEALLADVCEVEFTFESGTLWILQCRRPRRTGRAAITIATELQQEGKLDRYSAVARVSAEEFQRCLHTEIGTVRSGKAAKSLVARGRPVSPGAVSGLVYFDSKSAIEAKLQAGSAGTSRPELPASGASPPSPGVILVKRYTSSDDVDALEVVDGIITLRSGFATHSMVIARSWNKPFVAGVGKDIDVASGLLTLDDPTAGAEGGEIHISEGECITFDGSTGYVYSGNLLVSRGMPEVGPVEARERLLAWADEIRRSTPLRVRANVDTAAEAREAFAPANGATGIGMCRTEVLVEKMGRQDLLATLVSAKEGSIEERTALLELERLLTAELADLYHEAGRVPVAVRLLDRLDPGRHDGVDRAMPEESGVRGVRLAFMRPAVYQTQLRAIVAAATEGGRGNEPSLEVIVPFVIDPAEVRYVRGLLERTVNDIRVARGPDILRDFVPSLGAMLETPRAVMLSHLFAGECDFLSYGLNDLSDLVFGISSHDEELLHRYRDYGFLDVDPVTSIDRASVGLLVQRSIYAARSTKPHLEIGVAAVHARDRDSVAFLFDPPHPKGAEVPLSINYVSVAPEDLQIARLVTAQAVIAAEFGEEAGGPPRLDVTGPPGRP